MKIAMFSDNFYPEMSGISDSIIATAQGLAAKGHRINFYVPFHPRKNFLSSKLKPEEINLGKNIEIFRIPSLAYPPAPTKQGRIAPPFLFTYRHIKKFNPDLIHIHHIFGTGIEALLVSRLLKIPMVGTSHTPMGEFLKYGPLKAKWIKRMVLKYVSWLYNKCLWITAPCQAIIGEMKEYGFKKDGQSLSNPVNVHDFNPVSEEIKLELKKKFGLSSKTVLYTGRLAEEKKIDDIIRAIGISKEKFPDIMLAVTGHGNAEESSKELAKKLGLEKRIKFFGYLDLADFAQLYQAADIFAVMSTAETQCISMMQAMATGIPVICADAWGPPEYVTPESGFVVPPGDYKSLSQKINYLFSNPDEIKRLGQGGVEHVKNFSTEKIVCQWEDLYQKEIDKKKLKLSFVIPAWNEEKYIGQCLESVLKQIRKNSYDVEIIAVNNASMDKTRDIILNYPEVKLVDEPKKGLPQARQAGFLASTGDIIANMDADSILSSHWIEKAVNEFSRDKNLVALSGPYTYYDLSKIYNQWVRLWYYFGYFFHLILHYIFRSGATIQGGNFVLRRSALEKIGGFDVSIKFYGEETDIARRISQTGRVKFTFDFSMSTSGRRLRKDGMAITAWHYAINYLWVLLFKKPFTKKYTYAGDEKIEKNKQ